MIHLIRKFSMYTRGKFYSIVIRLYGGRCGKNIKIDRGFQLKYSPHAGLVISDGVVFGRDVVLDVPPGALLEISAGCKFTGFNFISANKKIFFGKNCLIAEMVSIRDADHGISPGAGIFSQKMICDDVYVGDDVWIGKGATLLKGSSISFGCVIGAGCVFNKKNTEPNCIYVGVPAKKIGSRNDDKHI